MAPPGVRPLGIAAAAAAVVLFVGAAMVLDLFSALRMPRKRDGSPSTANRQDATSAETADSKDASGGEKGSAKRGESGQKHKSSRRRNKVLIIGASGAIGRELTKAIVAVRGPGSVIAALRKTRLPADIEAVVVSEYGVDIRSQESLDRVVAKYAEEIDAVWNLAAPLSVDTAADPAVAHDVTVGGMQRLLHALDNAGLDASTKVCFSDSIGSYGYEGPRDGASARWLVGHPRQDPGSDYGKQKRACRELLAASAFDTRWAVIPGVLHTGASWGGGTTEYALEALKAAALGEVYTCPIQPSQQLPMIHIEDLTAGLVALMEADTSSLREPTGGYAIAGFSFSPVELYAEIRKSVSGFEAKSEPGGPAELFASLWPDSLDAESAERDLGFRARFGLSETVKLILEAHKDRLKE